MIKTVSGSRWQYPLLLLCLGLAALSNPAQAALPVPEPLDRIVAVVNENVITQTELNDEMQRIKDQFRVQHTPIPADEVLRKQLLDRMILREIQLQLADRTRIRVDDETLNRTLDNIAAQNNMGLDAFREALQREGIDYAAFRENMRKEIIVQRLQKREVNDRISVTKQEIEDFLANQALQGDPNAEYHLGHILIAVPEAASPEQITTARRRAAEVVSRLRGGEDFTQTAIALSDGQQALEGGDLGWRKAQALPSLFTDEVLKMNVGEISDPLRSPSGFHIIKLLDKRVNTPQQVVTQTHVRHILVHGDALDQDDDTRTRAQQLRDRLEAGEDFDHLAQAYSDDPGSAAKGGDLGWVNPGSMVPAFEQAMNGLAVNALSEPVQTQFGWHIIQVLGRRQHDNTDTMEHNKAAELIRARKLEPALQSWIRRLRDEAYVENRL